MGFALGTFADLHLWADPDFEGKRFRRDLRAHAVANPCPTCGAKAGELCTRQTDAGPVSRRLPHIDRGPSQRPHYRPSQRGQYQRRGAG